MLDLELVLIVSIPSLICIVVCCFCSFEYCKPIKLYDDNIIIPV